MSPKVRGSADGAGRLESLDGLRGIACLIVMNLHFSALLGLRQRLTGDALGVNAWFEQPWFHWVYAGDSMVDWFFVISGYVLAHKPLRELHHTEVARPGQYYTTIASSVLRRAPRLIIPATVNTLLSATVLQLGGFDRALRTCSDAWEKRWYFDISMPPKVPETSLMKEMGSVFRTCWGFVDNSLIPWQTRGFDSHLYSDVHWSIEVEIKCSLLLFILLMSTAPLKTRYRLGIHATACLYCFTNDRLPVFLFLAGMIVAELDILENITSERRQRVGFLAATDTARRTYGPRSVSLRSMNLQDDLRTRRNDQSEWLPRNGRGQQRWLYRWLPAINGFRVRKCLRKTFCAISSIGLRRRSTPLWYVILALGFYFSIAPRKPWATPSFGYAAFASRVTYYICGNSDPLLATRGIGAVTVVWTVANTRQTAVGSFLNCRTVQFLGKISFGLYLGHLDILRAWGLAIWPRIYRLAAGIEVLPEPENWAHGGGLSQWRVGLLVVCSWIACLPVVLLYAVMFCSQVDQKTTRWIKRIEQRLVAHEDSPRVAAHGFSQ